MSIYTRTLSRHELAMFNHPNPDIQRWWRGEFMESMMVQAEWDGKDVFAVFDGHEKLICQGCMM